jgi:hypothetical protein
LNCTTKKKKKKIGNKEDRKVKFQLIDLLGQLYNIIVYIQGSTACTNKFLELVGKKVLLDNCTK